VAVTGGITVYLSGQIPLVPETMEIVEGGINEQKLLKFSVQFIGGTSVY
jgi:enamine deaminase RidA (YjgF/YER057c/UK114 family)